MVDEFKALHNTEQVKARHTFMLALNEIKAAQDKSVDQKQIVADVSEGSELVKEDKKEDLTAALNEIKETQKNL